MKIVLAAAALSLCHALPGHAAQLRSLTQASTPLSGCIRHDVVRVSAPAPDHADALGCARFLSTSRVVQPRRIQRG